MRTRTEHRHALRALAVPSVLVVAALAACDDGTPARKAAAPPPPAAAPVPAAPPEQAAPAEGHMESEYVYTPIGKRDPFRSFFQDQTVTDMIKPNPQCGPLCRWDLDQLRLVAVVSGMASPVAMVEAPDSRGYLLRRGSFIGKRQGKVSDIRRDAVVVTELIRGNDGVIIPAKTDLRLRSATRTRGDEIVDLMNNGEGEQR